MVRMRKAIFLIIKAKEMKLVPIDVNLKISLGLIDEHFSIKHVFLEFFVIRVF